MKKIETVLGVLILIAAAAGLYFLFQHKPTPPEEQNVKIVTDVPVKIATIQRKTLHAYVQAYGTVTLQMLGHKTPPAKVKITSPYSGLITKIYCHQGKQVHKGDILFHLDSRQAKLMIEKAKQTVEFTKKELKRQKKLHKMQGTSAKQYEQALNQYQTAQQELAIAEVNLKLLDIRTPASGTIVRVDAVIGQTVNQSQVLAELYDLNRLAVSCKIPSQKANLLKIGQKAEILMQNNNKSTNNKKLFCRINYIDSQVDSQTGTRMVQASVPENSGLYPGQFVNCRIIYETHENCLVVPVESVVTTPEGKTHIALVNDYTATRKEVQPLLRENGLQEIRGQGLSDGMKIVTEGVYGLPDTTRINIINR